MGAVCANSQREQQVWMLCFSAVSRMHTRLQVAACLGLTDLSPLPGPCPALGSTLDKEQSSPLTSQHGGKQVCFEAEAPRAVKSHRGRRGRGPERAQHTVSQGLPEALMGQHRWS